MISRPLSNKGKTDVRNKDTSLLNRFMGRQIERQPEKNINRYIERKKEE